MPPEESEKNRSPRGPKPLATKFMPWADLFAETPPTAEATWQAHLDLADLFRQDGGGMPPRTFLLHIVCSQLSVLEQQVRRGAAIQPPPKVSLPPGKMFMPWARLLSDDGVTTEQILGAIHELSDSFLNQGQDMSKKDLLMHISCAQQATLSRVV